MNSNSMPTLRPHNLRAGGCPSIAGMRETYAGPLALVASLLATLFCILFSAPAAAQVACTGSPNVTCVTALQDQSCAGTRFGGNLGCTANDVSAQLAFTQPAANTLSSCISGTDVTVDLVATLGSGMPNRYDVGIFIGQAGNSPSLNNAANLCSLGVFPLSSTFTATPTSAFYNDPADNDSCGDFRGGNAGVPLLVQGVKIRCAALAGSNKVSLPFLLSWSQSAVNNGNYATCSASLVPGTTSKCNSSTAATITDLAVNGYVDITKATVPVGDTQSFAFTSSSTTGTPAWTLSGVSTTQTLIAGQTKRVAVALEIGRAHV